MICQWLYMIIPLYHLSINILYVMDTWLFSLPFLWCFKCIWFINLGCTLSVHCYHCIQCWFPCWWWPNDVIWLYYTPRFNEVDRGVYWYHLVRLSVCGQNRVRSVSSTILIGSISYLHILSSNFRRCVACNVRFKIHFGEFFKFVTLTLSSFDLGSNMTQWYG